MPKASEVRKEKEIVSGSFDRNSWSRRNRAGHWKKDLPDF